MKYFCLLIASLILLAESRSLSPSSFEEEPIELLTPANGVEKKFLSYPEELKSSIVSEGKKLEKLFADFAGKTGVDEIINEEQLEVFRNINSLKDLVDSVQELEIYYQDVLQDDGKHVKSRYEDSSAQFPLIGEETKIVETDKEDKTNETEEDVVGELDAMLVNLQNQINRMRKYLERLCRKRHPNTKNSKNYQQLPFSLSSANNPKKISIF